MNIVKFNSIKNIPPKFYKKFCDLNYRDSGMMRGIIQRLRTQTNNQDGMIYALIDGNTVCSFILVFKRYGATKNIIHAYTRVKCRNRGYAAQLIKSLKNDNASVKFYCEGNEPFFKQFGIKYV